MKRIVIILVFSLLLTLNACSAKNDPYADRLLSAEDWQAEYRCDEDGDISISLTNPLNETATVFAYKANDQKHWICQKKVRGNWESIIPNDGPSTSILEDTSVHLEPGESTVLHACYNSWSYSLNKIGQARLLLIVYTGEVDAHHENGHFPLGYLSFTVTAPAGPNN